MKRLVGLYKLRLSVCTQSMHAYQLQESLPFTHEEEDEGVADEDCEDDIEFWADNRSKNAHLDVWKVYVHIFICVNVCMYM